MGNPDRKEHHYGRECLINGVIALSMLATSVFVCKNMSWKNIQDSQYPDDTHAIVLPTSVPPAPIPEVSNVVPANSTQVEEGSLTDICLSYPKGLDHRDEACVGADCNGWTFFGKKEGAFPDHVVSWWVERYDENGKMIISCSDPAATQVQAPQ